MNLQFDDNYKKYSKEIKNLYLEAFPAYERRKFTEINDLLKKEQSEILSILHEGDFAGFFMLLKNDQATLIDYFAIKEEFRGQSIGTRALEKLDDGSPIIIEIEPIDKKSPNNLQRIKRKSFYQNLGFESKDIRIDWYDASFELMSLNDDLTADAYISLLDQVFTEEERKKNIRIVS